MKARPSASSTIRTVSRPKEMTWCARRKITAIDRRTSSDKISELMMIALRNIAIVIALMASTVALAASPNLNAAVRTACEADAQKFCSAVIGDRDSRRWCMVQHHAELSGVCKTAIARRKAAGSTGGDFCQNRCLRYCAMKQPAPGLYRGECHTACQRNCYRTRAENSSAAHQ
jgi:hypothetical protein